MGRQKRGVTLSMSEPSRHESGGMEFRVWSWESLTETGREAWVRMFARSYLREQQLLCPPSFTERTSQALDAWRKELESANQAATDQSHGEPPSSRPASRSHHGGAPIRPINSSPRAINADEVRQRLSEWDQMSEVEERTLVYRMAVAHRLNSGRYVPPGMLVRMEDLWTVDEHDASCANDDSTRSLRAPSRS